MSCAQQWLVRETGVRIDLPPKIEKRFKTNNKQQIPKNNRAHPGNAAPGSGSPGGGCVCVFCLMISSGNKENHGHLEEMTAVELKKPP